MEKTQFVWMDLNYQGPLVYGAMLYKNKWNAGIGLMFGSYVKRYFVLDLPNRTFSYYSDAKCKSGSVYKFDVFLNKK